VLRKYNLSLSTGVARYDPDSPSSLDELIARADALMYEKKRTKQRGTGD
jgi:PleD family two-component response regulator